MQDAAREHVVAARARHDRRQRGEDQRQQDAEQAGDNRRPAVGGERPRPPHRNVGEAVEDRVQSEAHADERGDVEEQRVGHADVADESRGLPHEQLRRRRRRSSGGPRSGWPRSSWPRGRISHDYPPVRSPIWSLCATYHPAGWDLEGLDVAANSPRLSAPSASRSCARDPQRIRETGGTWPRRESRRGQARDAYLPLLRCHPAPPHPNGGGQGPPPKLVSRAVTS